MVYFLNLDQINKMSTRIPASKTFLALIVVKYVYPRVGCAVGGVTTLGLTWNMSSSALRDQPRVNPGELIAGVSGWCLLATPFGVLAGATWPLAVPTAILYNMNLTVKNPFFRGA